ncbi:MAG: hypothetical protein Q9181_003580 [Wetmoreana brouardii]
MPTGRQDATCPTYGPLYIDANSATSVPSVSTTSKAHPCGCVVCTSHQSSFPEVEARPLIPAQATASWAETLHDHANWKPVGRDDTVFDPVPSTVLHPMPAYSVNHPSFLPSEGNFTSEKAAFTPTAQDAFLGYNQHENMALGPYTQSLAAMSSATSPRKRSRKSSPQSNPGTVVAANAGNDSYVNWSRSYDFDDYSAT